VAIAEQGRDIALASLEKPYLYVSPLAHSIEEWLTEKEVLRSVFRLKNHGKSPAIVKAIKSQMLLVHNPNSPYPDTTGISRHVAIHIVDEVRKEKIYSDLHAYRDRSQSGVRTGQAHYDPAQPLLTEYHSLRELEKTRNSSWRGMHLWIFTAIRP
jgi:hypothetical protein